MMNGDIEMTALDRLKALEESPSRSVSDEIEITRLQLQVDAEEYDFDYVNSFVEDIMLQIKDDDFDGSREEATQQIYHIVNRNHSGRGYFSWDGILDDMVEYLGFSEERARDILREC